MRIAITGSAGTGKSTLAAALGERLGAPVVPEGMREYLERTGIDLHDVGPDGLRRLVLALWEERLPLESAPSFVADRCSVDFAAFWLFYRFDHSPDTSARQATWAAHAARYDRVVVLPFGGISLVGDGIRTANQWTQLHFQLLLEGLLRRTVEPARLLWLPAAARTVEARAAWVLQRI